MEQIFPRETRSFSVSQQTPIAYATLQLISVFTGAESGPYPGPHVASSHTYNLLIYNNVKSCKHLFRRLR
jgi:hypothetical protein